MWLDDVAFQVQCVLCSAACRSRRRREEAKARGPGQARQLARVSWAVKTVAGGFVGRRCAVTYEITGGRFSSEGWIRDRGALLGIGHWASHQKALLWANHCQIPAHQRVPSGMPCPGNWLWHLGFVASPSINQSASQFSQSILLVLTVQYSDSRPSVGI